MWYGRWAAVWSVSKDEGEGELWVMVILCCRSVCVAMYDGCLVGIVEDVGIWYGWKSGFSVGYIECL